MSLFSSLPVIQAPMAGVQGSRLAVAVGQAGGLGSLPCAMLDEATLGAELAALRGSGRPFNLNFFCHHPPARDGILEQRWRERLRPYYEELGLEKDLGPAVTRAPYTADLAKQIEPFRPPVLSFHFGLPAAALLAQARSWGAKILASATTVEEALWLEAQGVDAVIAQGLEAGGHRGMFLTQDLSTQVGTFALLPQVVKAVRIPVIAAGGIADAAGVRAALALGATAVQVGTAYLLCTEADTSAVHRAALRSPRARHTVVTNVFTGRPARSIVNRLIREVGPMGEEVPAFPLASEAVLPLRKKGEALGSDDFSPLWCGQNASGCRSTGAAELTRRLAGLD